MRIEYDTARDLLNIEFLPECSHRRLHRAGRCSHRLRERQANRLYRSARCQQTNDAQSFFSIYTKLAVVKSSDTGAVRESGEKYRKRQGRKIAPRR